MPLRGILKPVGAVVLPSIQGNPIGGCHPPTFFAAIWRQIENSAANYGIGFLAEFASSTSRTNSESSRMGSKSLSSRNSLELLAPFPTAKVSSRRDSCLALGSLGESNAYKQAKW